MKRRINFKLDLVGRGDVQRTVRRRRPTAGAAGSDARKFYSYCRPLNAGPHSYSYAYLKLVGACVAQNRGERAHGYFNKNEHDEPLVELEEQAKAHTREAQIRQVEERVEVGEELLHELRAP